MAGRIVVLEFEDRRFAEAFVSQTEAIKHDGATLMAMFLRPDKYCDCPDRQRQNASNWRKGRRTGLYLCQRCNKPSKHHMTEAISRLKYVFGNNLLEVND